MPRPQGRGPRLRLYACFDGGSERAHRLAACRGALGQGGLRQGHDERRRNACFGGGLERAHGLDVGGGACFWQSRTGTARSSITHIIVHVLLLLLLLYRPPMLPLLLVLRVLLILLLLLLLLLLMRLC